MIAEWKKKKIMVTVKNVTKFLGPIKIRSTILEKRDEIGMSTGLAWTEAGGDILFIEIALMPGKGNLILAGQLGDVMKESCQAAMSYIRARAVQLGLSEKFYQKIDVHVHVPEGAVPKEVIRDLKFIYVSHMDEVLDLALTKPLPRIKEKAEEITQRPVLHAPTPYQAD